MSSVVLNSENNLSQCKKNLNMESDKVSDDSLFSSLFVIISDNNEESSLLDRNLSFSGKNQADGVFNIDNEKNNNELFSIFDEKFLLNDYKKSLNPNNINKEIIPKHNRSFSDDCSSTAMTCYSTSIDGNTLTVTR